MASADPWCKLWWTFYTSRAHVGIGWEALLVGPVLMLLAKQSPPSDDRTRWILKPNGQPIEADDVAPYVQRSAKVVSKGIDALVSVGTLVEREDGALGWPNFQRYQESAATERKRRERDRKRDEERDSHAQSHGQNVTRSREKGEVRGEKGRSPPASAEVTELQARADAIPIREPKPPPQPMASSGMLHELDMLRRELAVELQVELPSWGGQGGLVLDGIGRALEELGGDQAKLRAVIRHAALEVRDGKIPPQFFRRMWVRDGVGARIDAWRSSTSRPAAEDFGTPIDEVYRTLGRSR